MLIAALSLALGVVSPTLPVTSLATEAAIACRDAAFADLKLNHVVSLIDPANHADPARVPLIIRHDDAKRTRFRRQRLAVDGISEDDFPASHRGIQFGEGEDCLIVIRCRGDHRKRRPEELRAGEDGAWRRPPA